MQTYSHVCWVHNNYLYSYLIFHILCYNKHRRLLKICCYKYIIKHAAPHSNGLAIAVHLYYVLHLLCPTFTNLYNHKVTRRLFVREVQINILKRNTKIFETFQCFTLCVDKYVLVFLMRCYIKLFCLRLGDSRDRIQNFVNFKLPSSVNKSLCYCVGIPFVPGCWLYKDRAPVRFTTCDVSILIVLYFAGVERDFLLFVREDISNNIVQWYNIYLHSHILIPCFINPQYNCWYNSPKNTYTLLTVAPQPHQSSLLCFSFINHNSSLFSLKILCGLFKDVCLILSIVLLNTGSYQGSLKTLLLHSCGKYQINSTYYIFLHI